MNKISKNLLVLILILSVTLVCFVGCSNDTPTETETPIATETPVVTATPVVATYTVYFEGGDGSGDVPSSITMEAGESFTVPENTFSLSGYTFNGFWTGWEYIYPGDTYEMKTQDLYFIAQWTKTTTSSSGGGGGGGSSSSSSSSSTTTVTKTALPTPTVTVADGVVSWGSITGANAYTVYIDDVAQTAQTAPTLDLTKLASNAVSKIAVKASPASGSTTYNESSTSTAIYVATSIVDSTASKVYVLADDITLTSNVTISGDLVISSSISDTTIYLEGYTLQVDGNMEIETDAESVIIGDSADTFGNIIVGGTFTVNAESAHVVQNVPISANDVQITVSNTSYAQRATLTASGIESISVEKGTFINGATINASSVDVSNEDAKFTLDTENSYKDEVQAIPTLIIASASDFDISDATKITEIELQTTEEDLDLSNVTSNAVLKISGDTTPTIIYDETSSVKIINNTSSALTVKTADDETEGTTVESASGADITSEGAAVVEVVIITVTSTDKTYDGLTSVKLTAEGLVDNGSDSYTYTYETEKTITFTAVLADVNVGTNKGVIFTQTSTNDEVIMTFNNVYITVEQATPTISGTLAASEITYGQTLNDSKLSGATATFGTGNVDGTFIWEDSTIAPTVSNSDITTYTVIFMPSSANFNTVEQTVTLSVVQATPTYSGENLLGATYNETLADVDISAMTSSVDGVFTFNSSNETTVGNAGSNSFTMTFTPIDAENYETLTNIQATITVVKATYDMSSVVFEDSTVTYDGEAHSITATGLPTGVIATYDENVQTQANETGYTVTASFTGDSDNYEEIVDKTATFIINKATYDMTNAGWYYIGDFVYDGSEKEVYVQGLPNGVTASSYENNKMTNAGYYTASAELVYDSENYNTVSVSDLAWQIAKATSIINVSDVNTSYTYTGKEQSVTSGATIPNNEQTLVYSDNTFTNVGTYDVAITAEATTNYEAVNKAVTITVAQAENEITVLNVNNLTYGVSSDVVSEISATYGVNTAQYSYSADGVNYTTIIPTNAGTYYVKATIAETDNYKSAESSAQFVIEKAVYTSENAPTHTLIEVEYYTGITLADVEEKLLIGYEWTVNTTKLTVGTNSYDATYTNPNGNYETTDVTISIDVTIADLIQTAPTVSSENATITYGTTIGSIKFTEGSLSIGENAIDGTWAWETTNAVPTVAESGEYNIIFMPTDTAYTNFTFAVEVTVVPKAISISNTNVSVTYSGSDTFDLESTQWGTLNSSDILTNDSVEITSATAKFASEDVLIDNDAVSAQEVAIVYVLNNNNYIVSDVTTTGQINPVYLTIAEPTIVAKTYDGTTDATTDVTAGEVSTVIGTDNVYASIISATYVSANAGEADMTVSYELQGDDAQNYALATETAEQSYTTTAIAKQQLTITGTEVSSKTYDGTDSAVVTVGTPSDATVTVSATATFEDKNVGENKDVEVVYSVTDTNYIAPVSETLTASISTLELSVSGYTVDVAYDNKTEYALTSSEWGTLTGILSDDTTGVAIESATATFESENAESGKSVTIEYILSGDAKDNYYVSNVSTTGTINKADYTAANMPAHDDITVDYIPEMTLSDVGLDDDYSWVSGDTALSVTQDYVSYSATYVDPNENYNNATININVKVVIADLNSTAPEVDNATITYGDTIDSIVFTAGEITIGESETTLEGTWAWETLDAVPTVAESGEYNIIFTAIDTNYGTISFPISVTVEARALTSDMFRAISAQTYTGQEIEPGIAIVSTETLLTSDDFDIEYSNNVDAGTATVTIKGKLNHQGQITLNFTINSATDNAITDIEIEDWKYYAYDAEANAPQATNTYSGEITYVYYEQSGSEDEIDADNLNELAAGAYYVVATSTSTNYNTATKEITFSVKEADIIDSTATTQMASYTGAALSPTISATTVDGCEYSVSYTGDYQFTEIGEYTVNYTISADNHNDVSGEIDFAISEYTVGLEFTYIESEDGYQVTGYEGSETAVVIPTTYVGEYGQKSVTSIGDSAFANSSITSISLPSDLESIGSYAFSGCDSLTRVVIPNTVTTIGEYAFASSNESLEIYVYESELPVGWSEDWASNMDGIVYWYGEWYPDSDGNPYEPTLTVATGLVFELNDDGESYTVISSGSNTWDDEYAIPMTYMELPVTAIGDSAFESASFLEKIEIPPTVTYIGDEAFKESSLQEVIGAINVAYIGNSAFYKCQDLTVIELSESLTTIGDYAFYYCSNLSELELPNNLTDMGYWAFMVCDQLIEEINGVYYFDGWIVGTFINTVIGDIVIEDGTIGISDKAFYERTAITSINLPSSVCFIGDYTFSGCTKLSAILFTEGFSLIGDYMFSDCTSLQSVDLIGSIETIGDYAFSGCTKLSAISFAEGLDVIGTGAFKFCIIETLDLPNSLTIIGNSAFSSCSKLSEVEIPYGVTIIGDSAFSGCGLSSVVLSNTVESIGSSAFSSLAYDFDYIIIPDSVTYIGNEAFKIFYIGVVNYITIYCEADEIPSEWSLNWSEIRIDGGNSHTIYWGDQWYYDTAGNPYVGTEGVTDGLVFGDYLNGYGYEVIGYTGDAIDVVIPETYNGKTVYSIGANAFSASSFVKTVEMPETIKSIGNYAFSGCSITELEIPTSVLEIGNYSFYGCKYLTNVTGFSGVKSIGLAAFSNCTSLESIVLSENLTSIGSAAFQYASLKSITIPESITSIAEGAFYGCSSLEEVTILKGVTSIGASAFYDCTSLSSITISEGATSIGEYAFYGCVSLSSITISDDATSIGEYAFYGCISMQNIIIPAGFSSIENYTFYGCKSLENITIPEGVTSIGSSAFSYCINLENIVIPEGVTSIGDSAFSGCTSLTTVDIPYGVTVISAFTFCDCSNLTWVTIPKSVTFIGAQSFYDCYELAAVIPKEVEEINDVAFTRATLYVEIEESECNWVSNWQSNSTIFWGFSIDNPASDYLIYEEMSSNECYVVGYDGLQTTLIIPSEYNGYTVTGISFHSYSPLDYIFIPETVNYVSGLSNCTNLQFIEVDENNPYYQSIDGVLYSKEGTSLLCYPVGKIDDEFIINDNVETIGYSAFSNSVNLKSVQVSESIKNIENSAFNNCINLESINIPAGLESMGTWVFGECTSLKTVVLPESTKIIEADTFYNCTSLENIVIPEEVTSIDGGAFYGCTSIDSIVIPEGVTSIGNSAFAYCTSLETIEIPEGVESLEGTFCNCTSLKSVSIPDSVTSIGQAFQGCESLESIVIPAGVTSLDSFAFCGCTSLKNIIIPEGVESIPVEAFGGCVSLESVVMSGNVKNIDTLAFCRCGFTSIIIPISVTSIANQAFSDCVSLVSVVIPDSVTYVGSYAFGNCGNVEIFADIMEEYANENYESSWNQDMEFGEYYTVYYSGEWTYDTDGITPIPIS
ncbi:MAG: leucine-rich repeat protein [Bacillota bacterium]